MELSVRGRHKQKFPQLTLTERSLSLQLTQSFSLVGTWTMDLIQVALGYRPYTTSARPQVKQLRIQRSPA